MKNEKKWEILQGLRRTNSFDGSPREWYEFRGVRYSEEIERFDYPKYLDPAFWQVLVKLPSCTVKDKAGLRSNYFRESQ